MNALLVVPDWSWFGIGNDLLQAAVQHLRERAPAPVRLRTDPNSPAYDFNLRRGWRDTGVSKDKDEPDGDRFLELE